MNESEGHMKTGHFESKRKRANVPGRSEKLRSIKAILEDNKSSARVKTSFENAVGETMDSGT